MITKKQAAALKGVAKGLRIKQVAHELGVCEQAIKFRLAAARAELKAQNTTHAVAKAISEGIVEID